MECGWRSRAKRCAVEPARVAIDGNRRWCQKGRKLNNLVFARTSQRPRSWPLVRRGNRQLVVAHGSPELRVHPQHGQREPLAIEGEKRRNPILLLVGSGWVWNGERQCDCDAAVA